MSFVVVPVRKIIQLTLITGGLTPNQISKSLMAFSIMFLSRNLDLFGLKSRFYQSFRSYSSVGFSSSSVTSMRVAVA